MILSGRNDHEIDGADGDHAIRPEPSSRGPRARARAPRGLASRASRRLWLVIFLAPASALFATFITYPSSRRWPTASTRGKASAGAGSRDWRNFVRLLPHVPVPAAAGQRLLAQRGRLRPHDGDPEHRLALGLALLLSRGPWGTRVYRVIFFLPVTLSLIIVGLHVGACSSTRSSASSTRRWPPPEPPGWPAVARRSRDGAGDADADQRLALAGVPHAGLPGRHQRRARRVSSKPRASTAPPNGISCGRIIFPLLAPAVTIIVILTFIGSFNWFELPYVVRGSSGRPTGRPTCSGCCSTERPSARWTPGCQDIGIGSAVAVLMFVVMVTVSTVGAVYLRRREVVELDDPALALERHGAGGA